MISKNDVTNLLDDVKALKSRTEAAEAKVKALEEEKANSLATKGYQGQTSVHSSVNSDESRTLRAFGVASPKELLEVNIGAKRFEHVPADLKYSAINLKRTIDIARFTAQRFYGDPLDQIGSDDKGDVLGRCKAIGESYYGKNVLVPMLKAFGSTVAGAGAEWVPTAVSTNYLEEYELARVLESRFKLVNMPTNPFHQSKLKGVTKARIASENAPYTGAGSFAAANFQTDKIVFNATKLEEYYILPEELSEDSAPDFLGAGRDEVVRAQERGCESAIINGDADGTHQDYDIDSGAADLAEKAWDGLRKVALANSANGSTLDFGAAAVDKIKLSTLLSRMGKFGSNPEELLIIAGPVVYNQMRHLEDVFTVEKYGPMATVLKGALMAYMGIPVINSEHFKENLAATGVNTLAGPNDVTGLLIVNTSRFMVGQRRPIKVKVMPDLPGSDRWLMASYRRVTFAGHAQSASEVSVSYGYNVLK